MIAYCKSIDDLLDYHNCLFLGDSYFFIDLLLQHSAIAKFDYHDFEGVVFVDVIASHDMLALAEHHQLGLGFAETTSDLAHFLVGLELDCAEVEHFNGDHALGLVIHAFVDLAECASADLVVDDVFVDAGVGDGFACLAVLFVT